LAGGLAHESIKSIEPAGARIVRIGIDTAAMGRTSPTDLVLVGDVTTLADLRAAVESLLTKDRLASFGTALIGGRTDLAMRAVGRRSGGTMASIPFIPTNSARRWLATSTNSIVVSETSRANTTRFRLVPRKQPMWLGNTGAGLGWGVVRPREQTRARPAGDLLDRRRFGDVQRFRVLDAGALQHSGPDRGVE
jgi:thiamine pyrophosphate-dependent acetolactate synthase large subunit-like protein